MATSLDEELPGGSVPTVTATINAVESVGWELEHFDVTAAWDLGHPSAYALFKRSWC